MPLLFLIFLLFGPASGKEVVLRVQKIPRPIPTDPFHPAWQKAPEEVVPLMPQTIISPGGGGAIQGVRIRGLVCEREVFLRLEWEDPSVEDYPSPAEGFPDAAALEFPAQPESWPSPFMGDKENAVIIWRWSASAQKDLDSGYQGSRAERPRTTADLYAFAGDPLFRAGEAAGNILSQRRRTSPVENLQARGFGTITPTDDQPVEGKGVWRNGRWYVVFRRDLNGTPPFWHATRLPFAAAIWDGAERERDGMKSVSVWHTLEFPGAEERPPSSPVEAGRRVFRRYGCATCHGPEGKGGVANPNAQTNPIPPLTFVKEGFTREEILKVIRKGREPARADPNGAPPPFKMNAWETVMDPAEAEVLVDYLFSLMPKEAEETW